jgi:hypothetical protein
MMKQKKVPATVLLLGIWLLGGCTTVIVGVGAGTGAYTYIKGDLEKSYEVKFDKALKICMGILEDLNQPIIEKTSDGEKTTIETKRKNGSPQTIHVAIESVEWTQVSVRTGRVGYWDREVSLQFHEFFSERLKE